MVALYRCGRQPEALAAYQAGRRTMVEELGIEPSPALQRVERAILGHHAWLDPPPRAMPPDARAQAEDRRRPPAGGTRRRRLLVVAGTSLAVMLALFMTGPLQGARGSAPGVAGPDTVGIIDGSQNVVSAVVTGIGRPGGVTYGAGAVWITDSADDLLLRVDLAQQVRDRIPVGRGPAGVAAGDGEIWVANELDGTISEINPGAGTVVATIRVGNGPGAIALVLRIGLGSGARPTTRWPGSILAAASLLPPLPGQCPGLRCGRSTGDLGDQHGHQAAAAHRPRLQPCLTCFPDRQLAGWRGGWRGECLGRRFKRHSCATRSADRPRADDQGRRLTGQRRFCRRRRLGRGQSQRQRRQDRPRQYRLDTAHPRGQ